jgi:cobalamin synthase
MTTVPDPRKLDVDKLGLPAWAWPLIGLTAGLALVVLVHSTCFVDPTSE